MLMDIHEQSLVTDEDHDEPAILDESTRSR